METWPMAGCGFPEDSSPSVALPSGRLRIGSSLSMTDHSILLIPSSPHNRIAFSGQNLYSPRQSNRACGPEKL